METAARVPLMPLLGTDRVASPFGLEKGYVSEAVNGYTLDGTQWIKRPGLQQGTQHAAPLLLGVTPATPTNDPANLLDIMLARGIDDTRFLVVLIGENISAARLPGVRCALLWQGTGTPVPLGLGSEAAGHGMWDWETFPSGELYPSYYTSDLGYDLQQDASLAWGRTGLFWSADAQFVAPGTFTANRMFMFNAAFAIATHAENLHLLEVHKQHLMGVRKDYYGAGGPGVIGQPELIYSDFDDHTTWPPENDEPLEPRAGDRLTGIIPLGEIAYIGHTSCIIALTGSTYESFVFRKMETGFGIVAGRAAVKVEGTAICPTVNNETGEEKSKDFAALSAGDFKLVGERIGPELSVAVPRRMSGMFWKDGKQVIFLLGRRSDSHRAIRPTAAPGKYPFLVMSQKTGGWWKWTVDDSVAPQFVRMVGDLPMVGCADGHLRYFSTRRAFDMVYDDVGAATARRREIGFDSYVTCRPIFDPNGANVSLMYVEVKGYPGTEDYGKAGRAALATYTLTDPDDRAEVSASVDGGEWVVLGRVSLSQRGEAVFAKGKIDSGKVINVRVRHSRNMASPMFTDIVAGVSPNGAVPGGA
jgi:hypothetical protein